MCIGPGFGPVMFENSQVTFLQMAKVGVRRRSFLEEGLGVVVDDLPGLSVACHSSL